MKRLRRQALSHGLVVGKSEVLRVERAARGWGIACASGELLAARSVIVATGSEFLPLGVPGERELLGRGVGHAVFNRAARLAGKDVAVVGGGEAAAHQALALAGHARKVLLLVRGGRLKAIAPLREAVARHPRIQACYNSVVRRARGEGSLSGVEWRILGKSAKLRTARLDGLFVLVGQRPRLPSLPRAGSRTGALPRRGLFIAGDARAGSARQAAVAAADGISQAMECERFLGRFVFSKAGR